MNSLCHAQKSRPSMHHQQGNAGLIRSKDAVPEFAMGCLNPVA
ncbi:MAG: hypothetical protein ACLFT1_08280 [Desulfonatronovibrio sp.]